MDNPNPPKFERPEDRPSPPPSPPRKRAPLLNVTHRYGMVPNNPTPAPIPKDQRAELKKLAQALYNDGYACGITEDDWFDAYVLAMEKIMAGALFTEGLVLSCFDKIERHEE